MKTKTMIAVAAAAALLVSACQRKTAGTHPDPINAVLKCSTALTSLAVVPPHKRADRLFTACADLYAHSSCREAWTVAPHAPADRRTAHVMEKCRKAYCPDFKKMGFKICKLETLPSEPGNWQELWKPLDRAITEREFGPAAAKRALELKMNLLMLLNPLMVRHIPVSLPRAATRAMTTDRTTVVIYLKRQKEKAVVWVNGKRCGPFSAQPGPETLNSLLKALPPPKREVKILLRSDPQVPFSTIVTLMDHLRKKGYDRFGFSLNLPR